jgi:hypothetical protein
MSKHNNKPSEQKNPLTTPKTEPNKLIERIVYTGFISAITRLNGECMALRYERDRLRKENERVRTAFSHLENVVKEKDRAFTIAIIERDAWHKTAVAVDKKRTYDIVRRDIYEGRAKLWQIIWFVTFLGFVIVVSANFFAR